MLQIYFWCKKHLPNLPWRRFVHWHNLCNWWESKMCEQILHICIRGILEHRISRGKWPQTNNSQPLIVLTLSKCNKVKVRYYEDGNYIYLSCTCYTLTLQSLKYRSRLITIVEYTDPIKAMCTNGRKNGTIGRNIAWKKLLV